VVSFTARPLYPHRNSPRYLLNRMLGGPQSRSGRGGEEKNSQPPSGIEPQNPGRPARSPALGYQGVKRPGHEADHSPPSSAEVKNAWSYTSAPPIRLHGVVICTCISTKKFHLCCLYPCLMILSHNSCLTPKYDNW
jgi:hypothetical protein